MATAKCWSDDIPKDVAIKILELLQFHDDFMALGAVCCTWRSAAKEAKFRACVPTKSLPWSTSSSSSSSSLALPHDHHHLPWLIAAEPDDDDDNDDDDDDDDEYSIQRWPLRQHHRVYNLCNRMMYHIEVPLSPCIYDELLQEKEVHEQPQGLILSSRGWLLSITKPSYLEDTILTLFNPFSGTEIKLPTLEIWSRTRQVVVGKFIMSTIDNDDYYSVALILEEPYLNLSHQFEVVVSWKKGDDHWVQLGPLKKSHMNYRPFLHLCCDITFYRSEFYAVDEHGNLLAFEPGQSLPRLVAGFENQGVFSPSYQEYDKDIHAHLKRTIFYLVESMGRLLLLCRVKRLVKDHPYYKTISFQVFEVNVDNGDAKEVHNLGGNKTVFVGTNSSFSVEASRGHGSKPNCIYYTDDYRYLYYNSNDRFKGWDEDYGVYNLTTQKVESFSGNIGSLCTASVSAPAMWLESPSS